MFTSLSSQLASEQEKSLELQRQLHATTRAKVDLDSRLQGELQIEAPPVQLFNTEMKFRENSGRKKLRAGESDSIELARLFDRCRDLERQLAAEQQGLLSASMSIFSAFVGLSCTDDML